MKTQTLVGRLLKSDGTPYEGIMEFVPKNLWVMERGRAMACLAPRVRLVDGCFEVVVDVGKYRVHTPVGSWKIHVKETGKDVNLLSDHLPQRFK